MKTVLIVEDEKMIRLGLVTMVKRAPVKIGEILEAKDGLNAIDVLSSHNVDLLITDIRMPRMDGIELVKYCNSLENPPFMIVISGYDDFSYAVEMLRNGVHDYLLKPVERDKLYRAIESIEQLLEKRDKQQKDEDERFLLALRYIMLCKNSTEEECSRLIKENQSQFSESNYRICCSRDQKLIPDDAIVLQESMGRFVYLVFEKESQSQSQLSEGASAVPVGMSELHNGLHEMNNAYNEAISAWKLSFFTKHISVYSVVEEPEELQISVEHLSRLMALCRWQEAYRLLKVFSETVSEGKSTPEMFEEFCSEFVKRMNSTYKTFIEANEETDDLSQIWHFDNIDDYLSSIKKWMESLGDHIEQEFADYENKKKIWQAVQYIRENFRAPLNMAIVSNEISMNYSLFSLLFKRYTGVNFVSYLQNIRIEEAKRLLCETDWKVYEISAKSGFQDDKHFLKVFKMSVGVSPSEWRKTNLQNNKQST